MLKTIVTMFICLIVSKSTNIDTIITTAPKIHKAPRPAMNINEVIPQQIVRRMTGAVSIECALICENCESPFDTLPPDYMLHPYNIRAKGGILNEHDRNELLSILTDASSYLVFPTPGDNKCCFCNGHIAYIFNAYEDPSKKKVGRVAIIVCHDCSAIILKGVGANIILNIDYAADRLLNMTITLFPDDSLSKDIYARFYGRHSSWH